MQLKSFILASLATTALAKSAVLDLIPSNFDKIALSGKPALVEFFAPWCGHCKSLAPVYEELGQAFEFAADKVSIAKVDADAEKSLGKRFGIQGFPTLKWFDGKGGAPEEYKGGRDLESLTKFITEKTGIKMKKGKKEAKSDVSMLTDATFAKEIGGEKNVIVAFTAPWCGHCKTLAPVWESLATTFSPESAVLIAKVDAEADNSKATAQAEGVASYPTIKFFPAGSKTGIQYDGGRTEADLVKFLNEKAGTHRVAGGGLGALAGTIDALDALVKKYADGKSLAEIAAEVGKVALKIKDAVQKKEAEYYVKVFAKLAQNEAWVKKEFKRLEGLLKKGGLGQEKIDEMTKKVNVLRVFSEGKKEEVKEEL